VLEGAGLVSREVNAQWRLCRLRAPALQQAHGWLEHYAEHWESSLDRLTELVEARPSAPRRKPR
jgi:DNA-binding transcriptional ArsR family regulator